MTIFEQGQLLADRRWAEHQLRGWLGVPSPKAHRQADRWIDRMDAAEYELTTPDVVLRWR